MVGLLEEIRDRDEIKPRDEELDATSHESGDEEVSEPKTASQRRSDLGEDSLNLYFGEVGRTSLLTDAETKALSRQIEDGRHLAKVWSSWTDAQDSEPSATDLVLALMERFIQGAAVFDAVCGHLDISSGGVADRILNAELRRAIDDHIDEQLAGAVAEALGIDEAEASANVVELSLDSRLIPWRIVTEAGQQLSMADLHVVLWSLEFREEVEAQEREITDHFERVRELARCATDHMVRANLRLVVSVAKGHSGWGMPLVDLIQEGNIGLMQAVRKYDHRRGYKFSTYAIPWIWQAVNRGANDFSRMVRLPGYLIDDLTRLSRAKGQLAQELGRQPTEEELADHLELPVEKVKSHLDLSASGSVSMETPVGEEGTCLGDFLADQASPDPEEQADATLLRDGLSRMLEILTPRERRIVELRFGLDGRYSRTLGEVGDVMGLTKERTRQIEKEALAKLRHPKHSRELVGFLG